MPLALNGYVVDCPTANASATAATREPRSRRRCSTSPPAALQPVDRQLAACAGSRNRRPAYTAPNYPDQGGGGPMWSGFVVTMPWQVYLNYGDKRILETNYPMIQKWLAFADSKTKNHMLEPYVSVGMRMPEWNYLGDWVAPRARGRRDISRDPVSPVSSITRTISTRCNWPPKSPPSWASPTMRRCMQNERPRCAARCTNAISSPPQLRHRRSSLTWRCRCCSESFRRSCARPSPRT